MKSVTDFKKVFFAFMVLGTSFVVSSCDDDNHTPSLADANGSYKGKMLVTPLGVNPTSAQTPGIDIAAIVKSDTVYFDNFPMTELVASIVGEEAAPGIVEKIGKVSYKVGYKGNLNTAQDSIYMALDPKPLVINVPLGETTAKVEVTISAKKKGSYELSSRKLVFNVNADKVMMGENPVPGFPASEFAFNLKK